MTDSLPPRLVNEDSGLTPDERRALAAGVRGDSAEARARNEARHAVWEALVAKLPAAGGGAGAAAAGTGTAAVGAKTTLGALLKPLGVGLLLGVTAAGGVALTRGTRKSTAEPGPSASAASVVPNAGTSTRRAPSAADSVNSTDAPPQATTITPVPSAFRPGAPPVAAQNAPGAGSADTSDSLALPSEASFSSDLAPERARHLAESRRVADARALLLAGDARRALLELEAVRKDFPRGLLAQEREALAIEALGLLGERSEARQRADNFLRQYPGSPHATVVRKFLE